jgi:SAM-dependent methyltransferase
MTKAETDPGMTNVQIDVLCSPRPCPQCSNIAASCLTHYSSAPWQVVQCCTCNFVFLRNPVGYQELNKQYAWEKTKTVERMRRQTRNPFFMWLDLKTRWRTGISKPKFSAFLSSLWAPGRVLDLGCGTGHRVPEPFIPFGIEISDALFREADLHMRARGGYAIHAPALEAIKAFPEKYFTGILLRSFLEHELHPKKLLEQCARVLDAEGAIYLRLPNYGSLNRRIRGVKWCGFRFPDHVNYFTSKSLARMSADCGLTLRLLNPLRLSFDDNINAVLRVRAQ